MFRRIMLAAAFSLAAVSGAQATVVSVLDQFVADNPGVNMFDFRDAGVYGGCDGLNSCTRSEPDAGDRNVTITAGPGNSRRLYRDNNDGFGIRGNENDEVDADETLTISFENNWVPTFLGVTDLFDINGNGPGSSNDGGPGGEEVLISGFLNNVEVFSLHFFAPNPDNPNGEAIFILPGVEVSSLVFSSVEGAEGQSNDEYSVAIIAGTAPVPEPEVVLLLALGLIGLGGLHRRRKAT